MSLPHQTARDLALPIACQIITVNPLGELMASPSGKSYYAFLNALFQVLGKSANVSTDAFCRGLMIEAKTVLTLLPREKYADLVRFNASCRLFDNVYEGHGGKALSDPTLMTFAGANKHFVGERSVILLDGAESPADIQVETAADALLIGAKARGFYVGLVNDGKVSGLIRP